MTDELVRMISLVLQTGERIEPKPSEQRASATRLTGLPAAHPAFA